MGPEPEFPAGTSFPTVTVPALSRALVTLPEAAAGRVTLVTISFTRKAQAMAASWTGPFLRELGADPGLAAYEITIFDALWERIAGMQVKESMREKIPPERLPFVLPFYGDSSGLTGPLGITNRTVPWVFLLDRDGIVRWTVKGEASPERVREMIGRAREIRQRIAI